MKGKSQRARRSAAERKKPAEAAASTAPAASAPPEPPKKKGRVYSKVQRLMKAVFAENDPVGIAGSLLQQGTDATKAKIFVQCLEYLYGKPVQQIETRGPAFDRTPFEYITHIPRPKFPAQAPSAGSSSSPLSAASLSGRAGKTDSNEEDNHE